MPAASGLSTCPKTGFLTLAEVLESAWVQIPKLRCPQTDVFGQTPIRRFPWVWSAYASHSFPMVACTVVLMSNTRPLLLRWPCLAHRVYRSNWPSGSNPRFSIKVSARQTAIEVSSVHSPATMWKGPPPTIPSIFANDPGDLNSRVIPTASPTAEHGTSKFRPQIHSC